MSFEIKLFIGWKNAVHYCVVVTTLNVHIKYFTILKFTNNNVLYVLYFVCCSLSGNTGGLNTGIERMPLTALSIPITMGIFAYGCIAGYI